MILEEEVKIDGFQLLTGKSPGLDGIPIEFYQQYWEQIKEYYMNYINTVKTEGFSNTKNTSVKCHQISVQKRWRNTPPY